MEMDGERERRSISPRLHNSFNKKGDNAEKKNGLGEMGSRGTEGERESMMTKEEER